MTDHEGCSCFNAIIYGSVFRVWARSPTCEIHEEYSCLTECEWDWVPCKYSSEIIYIIYIHYIYVYQTVFIWESSSVCCKRIGIISSGSEIKHKQMFVYKLNPKNLARFYFTEHNTPLFVTRYLYLQVEPYSFSLTLLHIFRYFRWYIRNSTRRLLLAYHHIT